MKLKKKYGLILLVAFALLLVFKAKILGILILGVGLLVYSIRAAHVVIRIQTSGITCRATIVDSEVNEEGDLTPIIEFKTTKGEQIKGKPFVFQISDLIDSNPKNIVGKYVLISYDKDKPKRFVIADKEHLFMTFLIFSIGLGSVILGFADMLGYIKTGN